MTTKKICEHFAVKIYGNQADAMTAIYLPDQSSIRSICLKCLRARGIELPREYADLGGLSKCSCCAAVAECRDPDLLRRYKMAGIPPATVFYGFPLLRHPLNGDKLHMSTIDAIICAATHGEIDD